MLIICLIIFALAALLGIYLFTYVLQHKPTPKGIVFIHGPIAVLGIVLLIIYSALHIHKPWISLTLFILAAVGGAILILRDITGKSVPIGLALGHGCLALAGFICLVYFAFF